MRKEIIADTASSRMTNKKDTNDSKSSIFFIAMFLYVRKKYDPIFTNIFIIRRMPTFREAEIF